MRYAGIIKNDTSAGDGICVTLFVQGCHRRCKGCHNPETWDFDGGEEFTANTMVEIVEALKANGIKRNLCIMGGEPLEEKNLLGLYCLIIYAKAAVENLKIYLWTGYNFEDIEVIATNLGLDYVIDGPYIEELRDTTLKWRGSSNQKIWKKTKYGIWIEEK